jgi:very-short-patch-repair endonuclease
MITTKIFFSNFNCKLCDKIYDNYDSLRKHSVRTHKINSDDFYVQFNLNNAWPLCKCGCGQKTTDPRVHILIDGTEWQQTYIRGHISRIKNNWGHNKQAIKNSFDSRIKIYGTSWGCRKTNAVWNKGQKGLQVAWNRGLTKDTNESMKKMSEKLMGKIFSENHKNNLSISAKNSESAQKAQKINIQKALLKNAYRNNKLEQLFEKKYLDSNWEKQKYVGRHVVDFVNHKNETVIEVYGDYWHCNPKGKHLNWLPENYNPRIKMLAKDKWLKDKQRIQEIENKGYKVIVFWETDIKNNSNKIQETLNQFRDAST